ncbi:MAG: hypothetical protein CO095_17110 [Armatimonadetes bacterium CG_4_9_14_3_um_filter_58_7]|nr:MAG: hypothetical protein CO095_17110 [Armatimonadetes bacterium CG_4_9_14_3_um_filter_58_7]
MIRVSWGELGPATHPLRLWKVESHRRGSFPGPQQERPGLANLLQLSTEAIPPLRSRAAACAECHVDERIQVTTPLTDRRPRAFGARIDRVDLHRVVAVVQLVVEACGLAGMLGDDALHGKAVVGRHHPNPLRCGVEVRIHIEIHVVRCLRPAVSVFHLETVVIVAESCGHVGQQQTKGDASLIRDLPNRLVTGGDVIRNELVELSLTFAVVCRYLGPLPQQPAETLLKLPLAEVAVVECHIGRGRLVQYLDAQRSFISLSGLQLRHDLLCQFLTVARREDTQGGWTFLVQVGELLILEHDCHAARLSVPHRIVSQTRLIRQRLPTEVPHATQGDRVEPVLPQIVHSLTQPALVK